MSDRHSGLLEFLEEVAENFGEFGVVARKTVGADQSDLPITDVTADEGDDEICMVRGSLLSGEGEPLNVEKFSQKLRDALEKHPEFSLMVSDWFQIDEDYTARRDLPLDDLEIDEAAGVLRLFFQ